MPGHVARYLRFLALAAAAAGLVGAVGYLPTDNLAGAAGVTAMVVALVLTWVASACGGMPVLLAEGAAATPAVGTEPRLPVRLPVVAALGSMLIRLVAVVGLALAAVLSGQVAKTPLLLWTAIGYLALLGVDTWYVLGTVRNAGSGIAGSGTALHVDATSNGMERPR